MYEIVLRNCDKIWWKCEIKT